MSSRACNAVMRPAPERPVTTTNGRRVSWEALGREEAGLSGMTEAGAIMPPRFAPRQGATLQKPTLRTAPGPLPAGRCRAAVRAPVGAGARYARELPGRPAAPRARAPPIDHGQASRCRCRGLRPGRRSGRANLRSRSCLCGPAPSDRRPPVERRPRSGAERGRTCRRPTARAATPRTSGGLTAARCTWHGPAPSLALVGGRHANCEARAQHAAAARSVGGSPPVGGRDRAAVGLHDLPADRQAEPRMLAEMLGRPLRVETLEDRFEVVLGNARALVVDGDDERTAARLAAELDDDARAGRAEGQRIVEHVAEDLAVTTVMAVRGEGRVGGEPE